MKLPKSFFLFVLILLCSLTLFSQEVGDVLWEDNFDDDFMTYHIYKSSIKNGIYERITSTNLNYYVNHNFDVNNTYYYKISAVDYSVNESELSKPLAIKFAN